MMRSKRSVLYENKGVIYSKTIFETAGEWGAIIVLWKEGIFLKWSASQVPPLSFETRYFKQSIFVIGGT